MPPEEDRAMATGDLHKKIRDDWSSCSRDMLADRHTDRQADLNTALPYWDGVMIVWQGALLSICWWSVCDGLFELLKLFDHVTLHCDGDGPSVCCCVWTEFLLALS